MRNCKHVTKLLAVFLFIAFIFSCIAASAQSGKNVSGIITTQSGGALSGVSITVKGTTHGVVSDEKGAFVINAPANATLVFAHVGYKPQEMAVKDQATINIVLEEEKNELAQVVVIGYGTVKKSDLTGSVSSVKAEDIKAVPVTSFDQALQGRAAGVQVTQMSGKPGAETSIRIRGTTSINAGNEPLYVIDGMLVNSDAGDMSTGVTLGPRISALSAINPNDIESIEILKDASATAIYGSRGANGVVLITTKRGKSGKGVVTFDAYYAQQVVAHEVEVLNAAQFGDFVNDAKLNANQTPVYVNPKKPWRRYRLAGRIIS
jgi:TonB-dependent SusC/RagA subfamily outer membrane receptor